MNSHSTEVFVPVDAALLDDLIGLAVAHVQRLEAQRTTQANRLAKQQSREIVDRAKELLREYAPIAKAEGA